MNELLTFAEVEAVEGISRRTRQRRIKEGVYRVVSVEGTGGKGARERRIPLECLSAEGQARWGERQSHSASSGQAVVSSEQSVVMARNGGLAVGRPQQQETAVSSEQSHSASSGQAVVAATNGTLPVVRDKAALEPQGTPPPSATPEGIPLTPDGLPDLAAMRELGMGTQAEKYVKRMGAVGRLRVRLEQAKHGERREVEEEVAAECGMTARHLRRLDRLLREGGHLALVPIKGLSRRGHYRAIPGELQAKILESWSDYCGRTTRQIYRHVVQPWCQQAGTHAPSYRTVCIFLARETKPIERAAFRKGPREFKAHYAAKVVRDLSSIATNEVWVSDHRLFDTFVLQDGKAKRPWLTAIFDVKTAGLVGYEICAVPSSVSVAHALRRAILSVGAPRGFLRDNGKEFTSKRLGGKPMRLRKPSQKDLGNHTRWPAVLPSELESGALWAALGVELITALPYHAWSKPAEAFFGAMSRATENLMPGWAGRNAQARPEILKRHIANGQLLDWQQFEEVFARIVSWWNGDWRCADRTQTPAEAYADYEPQIPSSRSLDVLLQDVREVKVRTYGLKIDGRLFQSEELARYVSMPVTIRRDPAEPWVMAYTSDGCVLAVPEAPRADWQGFGPANELAKRCERAQRHYLKGKHEERSGHCTPGELDPLGGFAMVAERLSAEATEQRQESQALDAAATEAERQIEARERAEEDVVASDRKRFRAYGRRYADEAERRRHGDYSDLLDAEKTEKARTA